jgi:hypothetical protein
MITAKLMKYNQDIVFGNSLSLVALKRVLDFIEEYADNTLVTVHINSTMSKPLNTVRILTPEDFYDGTGKMRRAALIVLDREEFDGEEEEEEEEEDTDSEDVEDDDFED